jgi:hypothetical protein
MMEKSPNSRQTFGIERRIIEEEEKIGPGLLPMAHNVLGVEQSGTSPWVNNPQPFVSRMQRL